MMRRSIVFMVASATGRTQVPLARRVLTPRMVCSPTPNSALPYMRSTRSAGLLHLRQMTATSQPSPPLSPLASELPSPPPPQPVSPLLDAQSRSQLAIICGTGMMLQMAIGMIIPMLPAYAAQIGMTSSGVGLIVAMPSVARLVLNLPLGSLIDTIGRKPLLIIGTTVEAIGVLGTAFASSLATMLPPRLLVGAGSAGAGSAGTAYLYDVVDKFPERKGFLLGTVQAAMMLAFAAGPACGGLLAERCGSASVPFFIVSAVLAASVPLYARLPETRPPAEGVGLRALLRPSTRGDSVKIAVTSAMASFRALLVRPEQQALLILRFGLCVGWGAWLTVLPLHAAAVWGAGAGDLGIMFSLIALLGFVSAPIGGLLADRVGRTPIIAAGSAISALAIGALPWAESKLYFYVCMAAWDIGEAMLTAAATALTSDLTSEDKRGAQTSLGTQVQDLTFVIAPVLLGTVAAAHSNSAALLLTAGAMLTSNLLFALRMRAARKRRRALGTV